MFDDTSPSESLQTPARWSDGAAEIAFAQTDGETRLKHLYQSDPCRVLFPARTRHGLKEAVIVTTSGGVVGGDRLRFAVDAGIGTSATVTTQAAEKIYRSARDDSVIDISVSVRDQALIEWMPQETILFQGARLRRRTIIDLFGSARVIAGEIVVFGRRARDEVFSSGLLHDSWRVCRDDALVWADDLHMDGDIGATLSDVHAFHFAAAVATVIYGGADAAEKLDFARDAVDGGAVSCVDDLLVARFIDRDAARLRSNVTRYWAKLRGDVAGLPSALPRVWET